MVICGHPFDEVWTVDFEFGSEPGECPEPICLVAHELGSGRTVRLWSDELRRRTSPPYSVDRSTLFIAYYASAEFGCHLRLGWPLPTHTLDLFTEFRVLTNGCDLPCGSGLLGALAYFGLDGVAAIEKEQMRALALRGGPWTAQERKDLVAYCESDVVALERLLRVMLPKIDLPRALLRGRYMAAAARMETRGVPIDLASLETLRTGWEAAKSALIQRVDAEFGVFDGLSFKASRFEDFLARRSIPWPRLTSGKLALDDNTFRDMSRGYPSLAPLRELRHALSQMRLDDLAVGRDGRNRTLLSAFRAKTGRNQPSTSRFIFGPSVWLRGLIRPVHECGLAYLDWSQQEFGIAAALSGDSAMIEAYESGDPYLAFAKQAGAVPTEATKDTHPAQRDHFKACVLAVQYGMGEVALAFRIGQPPAYARELLRLHRATYRRFWRWSDAAVDHAMLRGVLHTVYGWQIHVGRNANSRSLRNFPMQANGAEMLRIACCFATERGVGVCAPVHDAMLIEAPADALDDAVAEAERAMAEASRLVLDGLALRSDRTLIVSPERYSDPRGERMWSEVWALLGEANAACAPSHGHPVRSCDRTCAPAPTGPI